MTDHKRTITVEVVYATLEQVWSMPVALPAESACVEEAIASARGLPQWPNIELDTSLLAIFGQTAHLNTRLHEGDRIEILRPLLIDPMDARRGRVEKKAKK
jgi:uncharacterized protein